MATLVHARYIDSTLLRAGLMKYQDSSAAARRSGHEVSLRLPSPHSRTPPALSHLTEISVESLGDSLQAE